jgi:integrase
MLSGLEARGGLSPTTRRYAYSVLRIALGRAVKGGKVSRNVATLVDAPAKARREMHPLSAEQTRAFLQATANGRHGPLYAVAVATGMRQGELLGLRWQDVDLEARTLAVRYTLVSGTDDLAEPKTERSRRTLRLSATALGALREQRRRQLEERLAVGRRWHDREFVFTNRTGGPLDSRHVTQGLQRTLRHHGMPPVNFHTFGRHGYATLMLEAGEELAVVSKVLGHSNLSTTADTYAHLVAGMLERSANRLDAILGPQSEAASG